MFEERMAYSVSEYVSELNAMLTSLQGEVIGEVSELKRAASGHVYFTIKDKDTKDILPCTIWRTKYELSGVDLEVGMEVLVRGKAEYYGPFGKLSLIVNSIQLVGEGALLKAYEKLKNKLELEGIFDPAKKRSLPEFPHTIGVITSVHGAVIHDFTKNLRKYGFKVKIRDTRVEGPESGKDLTLSVRAFKKERIDVLVLLRGGGSVQSLAGFDNEALVREIASFPVPVLAGLGHHQDVPLAALAADVMQSTPSFVAELLNQSWDTAEHSLERSQSRIIRSYSSTLNETSHTLQSTYVQIERALESIFQQYAEAERAIQHGLTKISFSLGQASRVITNTSHMMLRRTEASLLQVRSEGLGKTPIRISTLFGAGIKSCSSLLDQTSRLIETNDPERQLRLGYSLAFQNGSVVRSSKDLQTGSALTVRFATGSAETIITELT